jgi:hypothetical protein
VVAGIAAAVVALATGLGGVIPALVAAGVGLAAFGALAYPVFTGIQQAMTATTAAAAKYQQASLNLNQAIAQSPADLAAYQATIQNIEPDLRNAARLLADQNASWQALSPSMQASVIALYNNKAAVKALLPDQATALKALVAEKAAWDQLSPQQRTAAGRIQALSTAWQNMQQAIQPMAFKVIGDLLGIANKLLPDILPFAQAAGTAIDGLLKGFDKFAGSKGFKDFLDQLVKQVGPAITIFGDGIGKIIVAVGKLVIALTNPNALRMAKGILDGIAGAITGLAWAFQHGTPVVLEALHGIAENFDHNRRAAAAFGHDVAVVFDKVRHAIASAVHMISNDIDFIRNVWVNTGHWFERVANAIVSTFDQWRHNVAAAVDGVAGFFVKLPGRIVAGVGNLGSLLWNAGVAVIQGLIGGIASGVGVLWSYVQGIASSISHAFSSALHIFSPSRVFYAHGVNTLQGYIDGLKSMAPQVHAAMAGIGGQAAAGGPGGPAFAGAGGAVNVTVPLTVALGPGMNGLNDPRFLQYMQEAMQEAVLRYVGLNGGMGMLPHWRQ